MKAPQHKTVLFLIFIISAAVIFLNRLTSLYINSSTVHFIFFFIAASSFTIMVFEYLFDIKTKKSIAITLFLVLILSFGKAFLTWGGDWKTQTVIFRNKANPERTIEFQMRGDRFAFGYKKQIVERRRIMPYFDQITHVDTSKVDTSNWMRVDEYANEMELPGENVE